MQINSVSVYKNSSGLGNVHRNNVTTNPEKQNNSIQKSIYNSKGTNIYFGCLAKGADIVENECIDLLRSARYGRYRRFDENDITEILSKLKVVKKPEDKKNILLETLELDEEYTGVFADNKFFKRVLGLVANKSEQERFAILEFAANELQNAVRPLETFAKLSDAKQQNLAKLLVNIDDVNRQTFFKDNDTRVRAINALYDTFRVPLYSHDDIANMNVFRVPSYKNKYRQILNDDMDYYRKQDGYADAAAKSKVISVVDNIINYFEKNVWLIGWFFTPSYKI